MGKPDNLLAHHVMEDELETCPPATSALAIAYKLCKGHFGSLPVVDDNKSFLGLVTEFDLLQAIEQKHSLQSIPAPEIMSHEVITVTEGTPLVDIIKLSLGADNGIGK